ncbi:MAG: hypothetical protein ABEI31_03800 [Halodesulfurarchaeum sp.]
MPRAVALNVGANTSLPGFRAPIYPDGSFEFIPIPERAETAADPPTYGDLGLDLPDAAPEDLASTPVHLDPAFDSYPCASGYTYGDPWGVKARPIRALEEGEYLFFYATLDRRAGPGSDPEPWLTPDWGAYLIGHFRLARDPVSGDAYRKGSPDLRERFADNAHVKRDPFDAAVLVEGDDSSRLYRTAAPLSGEAGTEPNHVVTEWSADSGRGPWWRRPLRFDASATEALLEYVTRETYEPVD